MNGDAATLAFADLQPEDIVATLVDVGFDCDGRFLALNSYENRVYQVGIEDSRPVVAKFYRPGRWSDAAILEEHAFSSALEAQEVPVVSPLQINGTTLLHAGHYRLAVYPCRGGRAPDLDNYELLKQLGFPLPTAFEAFAEVDCNRVHENQEGQQDHDGGAGFGDKSPLRCIGPYVNLYWQRGR